MKIQSHYPQIKGFFDNLPKASERYNLADQQVNTFHEMLEKLKSEYNLDLSIYKLEPDEYYDRKSHYSVHTVKGKVGSLIGFLEGEYDLQPRDTTPLQQPFNNIPIVNQNTILLTITQSIQQIIEQPKRKRKKKSWWNLNLNLKNLKKIGVKFRNLFHRLLILVKNYFFNYFL